MTHTYQITGMTCTGCQAKVQHLLSEVNGVKHVTINLEKGEADIEMEKHVDINEFKQALNQYPKYTIEENKNTPVQAALEDEHKSWFQTYRPVLTIFFYITVVTLSVTFINGYSLMLWMNYFMAGFFIVFSFFKLLNIQGFAEGYAMYDIIAMRWKMWGYIYAFLELALGLAFLTGFMPLLTNTVTFAVMSISIIGVLKSVIDKKKIKCACLGDVVNLPMSTITIIEDGTMIIMSLAMIAWMWKS
jgi:copper chaperone CopZ